MSLDIAAYIDQLTIVGTYKVADDWTITVRRPPTHRRLEMLRLFSETRLAQEVDTAISKAKEAGEQAPESVKIPPVTPEEAEAIYEFYLVAAQRTTGAPPQSWEFLADRAMTDADLSGLFMAAMIGPKEGKPDPDPEAKEATQEASDVPFLSPASSASP